ncbi:glucosamine inositolphosphorylceramide transferase family protein [Luteimonas sp. A478]
MNREAVAVTPLYSASRDPGRPLRVVLVAPTSVPGWLRAFRDLAVRTGWVDLVVVSGFDVPLPAFGDVGLDMRLFLAVERTLHRNANASLDPEVISREQPKHRGEGALERQLEQVETLSPDVVLLAGPQAWASSLAPMARLGCWHLDASLTDPRYAGLSLVGSVLRGDAATRVELVLQGAAGTDAVLAGSSGRTRVPSFLMTRDDAFAKLPQLLLRGLLRAASASGTSTSSSNMEGWPERQPATLKLSSRVATRPGEGLRLLLSTSLAKVRSLARRFNYQGWALVVRTNQDPLDPDAPVIGTHAILEASEGWWADPCVVTDGSRTIVFVEEMDLVTNKAFIACVELVDGGARRLGTALREPGHLSFPQVFAWQGQWYMTVESGYARRASLYRAVEFPLQWVRIRDLVTGWSCVDPVLHHHDGHWYLFLNVAESGDGTSDDLFLFVAASLEGPFRPHPASPLVCDVRRARMAGRLFHHQGRLIRPSQDCGPNYGSAVVFNEVLELGPQVYRERELSRLTPDWGPALHGCHTYSAGGDCEVLDVAGRPPAGSARLRLFDGDLAGCS